MKKDEIEEKISFNRGHSKLLNIWHWSNLLIFACTLTTVLLAKTMFNAKTNSPLVQNELEKKGVIISLEQAKSVSKIFTHKLWDWHIYFGYVLIGLLLFRLFLEFFQHADEKIVNTIKNSKNYFKQRSGIHQKIKHFIIVKYIYLHFYTIILFMAVSGLFIKFSEGDPDLKQLRSTVKDLHTIGMYFILAFIITHLCGLLIFNQKKLS
jgi:Ni,Fe-hydrogenase I cytochrome b subunit